MESILVSIRVFDEISERLNLETIDFLKIDVQGYECHVLAGMQTIIGCSTSLTVLAEYWPIGLRWAKSRPEQFLEFFRTRGFEVYHLGEDGVEREIEWDKIDDHLPDLPGRPGSIYLNLVFRRPSVSRFSRFD